MHAERARIIGSKSYPSARSGDPVGESDIRWIEAWEKVSRLLSRSDAVNLDRKETVLVSFLTLQSAMR